MSKGDFTAIGRKKKQTDLEAFVEGASVDGKKLRHDFKAKRNFKDIRMPFNQAEYELLTEAAADENLTLTAYIRTSWMARAQNKGEHRKRS